MYSLLDYGRYLYSWGTLGDHPGGFFNMHGASKDSLTASPRTGRVTD